VTILSEGEDLIELLSSLSWPLSLLDLSSEVDPAVPPPPPPLPPSPHEDFPSIWFHYYSLTNRPPFCPLSLSPLLSLCSRLEPSLPSRPLLAEDSVGVVILQKKNNEAHPPHDQSQQRLVEVGG
jgi:hypothetical protein